jgi:hypothetical protein
VGLRESAEPETTGLVVTRVGSRGVVSGGQLSCALWTVEEGPGQAQEGPVLGNGGLKRG